MRTFPLSLDPLLLALEVALSQHDNTLHTGIVNSFNHLGHLVRKGRKDEAAKMLIAMSEYCEEGRAGLLGDKGR